MLLDKIKDDSYITTHFHEFYGQLVLYPEKLYPYTSEIREIMVLLKDDYASQNAYRKLDELLNQIGSL